LAGGRNIGSPLAGVDVVPTLNHHWNQWLAQRHVIIIWSVSNVAPMDVVQWLGQRWTIIYFLAPLIQPAKMALGQPLIPTLAQ